MNKIIIVIIVILYNNTFAIDKKNIVTDANASAAMFFNLKDSIQTNILKAKKLNKLNQKEKALKLFLNTLNYSNQSNDTVSQIKCSISISDILKSTNNFDKALGYSLQALRLSKKLQDSTLIIDNLISIGSIHYKLFVNDSISHPRALDSIDFYFKKALTLTKNKRKYSKQIGKAYSGLSGGYFYRKDYNNALKLTLQAIEKAKQRKDSISQVINVNILASIYLQTKKYNLAQKNYQQAFDLLNLTKSPRKTKLKEMLYINIAWTKYNLKDYDAYSYLAKANKIKDSLRDVEFDGIISEIEAKHNVDIVKQNAEKRRLKEVQKREKLQLWGFVLIILFIGLGVSFWIYRKNSKLTRENIQLQLSKIDLLREKEIEQLQNETQIKILNATLDGKETERKQIAETLHDSVSALLSAANLHLQASKSKIDGKAPIELDKTANIIDEASVKIRDLSHKLISSVLLKFGLSFAVQDFCEKFSNSSLEIIPMFKNVKRYEQNFEIKINNIIEEFVNNIIKHSQANEAYISILEFKKQLYVSIQDNGIGFDSENRPQSDGIGINQIEARIHMMKGELTINSVVGSGTKIDIKVPIVY